MLADILNGDAEDFAKRDKLGGVTIRGRLMRQANGPSLGQGHLVLVAP